MHELEFLKQERLDASPIRPECSMQSQRIIKAIIARGMIPKAFGTSKVPERWGLWIILCLRMAGGEAGTPVNYNYVFSLAVIA